MKLSQNQLRKLISEAIQGRRPGEPEPFSIDEANAPDNFDDAAELAGRLEQAISNTVQSYFEEMYNEGDPSMAASGKEEWNAQASQATAEITSTIMAIDEVTETIAEVVDKLIDGEYYQGRGRGQGHRYTGGY